MATNEALQHSGDIFEWRQLFDRFDADESGFLDGAEMTQLAHELWGADHGSEAAAQGKAQLETLISQADNSGDGEISWEEFLILMQRLHHGKDEEGGG